MKLFKITCLISTISILNIIPVRGNADPEYGIAAGYPGDIGIESHPSVIFTENFEESSIDEIAGRWEDISGRELMSLSSETPAESVGRQSLLISGGGHLYRRIQPGQNILYVRLYAKFDPSCNKVHHWVHMGGYNPTTPWPQGGAGERPVGNERWTTGIEPMGENWAWDFYTYWMHMRTNPDGHFWGNTFSGRPSPWPAIRGEWFCVEFMVKMNEPPDSFNGEQSFWINGEKKNHLGPGFPRGEWVWDGFYPNPDCTPSGPCDPDGSPEPCCTDFEGFQWRSTTDLNINFVWLLHYVDSDPGCEVWFDDLVVATEYVGPIVTNLPPNDVTEPQPDFYYEELPEPNDTSLDMIESTANEQNDAIIDLETEGEKESKGCGCIISY